MPAFVPALRPWYESTAAITVDHDDAELGLIKITMDCAPDSRTAEGYLTPARARQLAGLLLSHANSAERPPGVEPE